MSELLEERDRLLAIIETYKLQVSLCDCDHYAAENEKLRKLLGTARNPLGYELADQLEAWREAAIALKAYAIAKGPPFVEIAKITDLSIEADARLEKARRLDSAAAKAKQ